MRKLYVHTRANGFRRWVCVDTAPTVKAARERIEELKRQDDPTWASAEYLISDTRHPLPDAVSL